MWHGEPSHAVLIGSAPLEQKLATDMKMRVWNKNERPDEDVIYWTGFSISERIRSTGI